MSVVEERLAELGLTVPEVVPPVAAYTPAVVDGSRVYVSGQLPMRAGALVATGQVGEGDGLVEPALAKDAAQQCALNAIAAIKSVVGDLDRVARIVKVVGFVASELFGHAFGEKGIHARSAVGVVALPLGASVEVEVIAHLED